MPQQNNKILYTLVILSLLISLGGLVFSQSQVSQIKEEIAQQANTPTFTSEPPINNPQVVNPGFTIPTPIITATPTATSKPKPTPTQVPLQQFPKTVYIPLGGGGSTQSTDWVDVPNDEVWLDFGSEFGSKAHAVFEAFLRVDNANGTAYARLMDVTHGITVNGSEISLDNNSQFNLVVSNNLTFWAGKNLYKVQVKSLNSSTVFLDSARIKVGY